MSKIFPYEHGQYIRIAEYFIDDVLPYVVNTATVLKLKKAGVKKKSPAWVEAMERNYDGHMVKMTSQRYQLFASKGVRCVGCGITGQFFGLEKAINNDVDRYHFNLYGHASDGTEVLITKDHIVPKSRGGRNVLSNYQVMCYECNADKGDKLPTECDAGHDDKASFHIEHAIKSLELISHVEDFNSIDYTDLQLEQLHYGAICALKHLKEIS